MKKILDFLSDFWESPETMFLALVILFGILAILLLFEIYGKVMSLL